MKETNELILKFIGAEFSEPYWRIPKTGRWTQDKIQYHSSWDWLKPVIAKIKDNSLNEYHLIDKIDQADISGDRDATYNAVVEFIKFYNQNK
ncbi:MAG: hypothetical protein ACTSQA_02115 [Candidatus Heimdallarchaeaceae archaeon]